MEYEDYNRKCSVIIVSGVIIIISVVGLMSAINVPDGLIAVAAVAVILYFTQRYIKFRESDIDHLRTSNELERANIWFSSLDYREKLSLHKKFKVIK